MDNNKYMLYSGSTKMADVILRDYRILSLLPRFDMRLGFGDKTLSEVCAKHGVNECFFLLICNINTFDDYFPDKEELDGLNILAMVSYLKRSHDYYVNHRIIPIEQKLQAMANCCSGHQPRIIGEFFAGYKQEILNHFEYEESVVFPNIINMEERNVAGFHINQYEENHSNIDDKLSDLKNIIIKYLPENCSTDERNDILTDIFLFEEDLTKHTRIEDKILIPYVRKIEGDYEEK